jgi:hypothetical protein
MVFRLRVGLVVSQNGYLLYAVGVSEFTARPIAAMPLLFGYFHRFYTYSPLKPSRTETAHRVAWGSFASADRRPKDFAYLHSIMIDLCVHCLILRLPLNVQ